jgi:hypothetical protein
MNQVMKKGVLQRGVVLFLLIFALTDITSANPCGDELDQLPLPVIDDCKSAKALSIPLQQSFADTAFEPMEAQHEHSQHSETACEDCFCCCSHILPSANFSPQPITLYSPISDLNKLVLPAAPPRDTFRPPRRI